MNKTVFKIIHYGIILHFLLQILYAGYVIFVVLRPEGAGMGPLAAAAADIDMTLLLKRRLYAIECWVATAGLVIYLALTSFRPMILELYGPHHNSHKDA